MKAIFVTEKEAREFINNNFGQDAILKDCEVSDSERFDIDEVPYQWGGSTFAYEVNNGEAYVGFMEEPVFNFGMWFLSRKPSISSRFSSFVEYRLLQ